MTYKKKLDPADPASERVGRTPKDVSSSQLVATGEATTAQIAGLFGTDPKTLPKRLRSLAPVRSNARGHKIYNIADAASFIVRPGYEIESYIRQMSPQELPPLLAKEFWNGQNARMKYEKDMGNLWPTERVVEVIGAAMNGMRMAMLLIKDSVERETDLTQKQRKVIERLMDGGIADFRDSIIESMEKYNVDDFDGAGNLPEPSGGHDPGDDGYNILAAEDDTEEDIGI